MASPPTGKDKGKDRTHSAAEQEKKHQGSRKQAAKPSAADPSAAESVLPPPPTVVHRHHSESETTPTQPLPETSSSNHLGLLRLSDSISQSEAHLHNVPLLSTTIADSQTLENIPSIGASPGMAMAPPGGVLHSQEYVQSTPVRPSSSSHKYSSHDAHADTESQPLDVLSFEDLTQDVTHDVREVSQTSITHDVTNTSFSSPNSRNTSYSSHHNTSIASIESNSSHTNTSIQSHTSIHSQISNGSSNGSHESRRSQGSQISRTSQLSSGSQSHSSGSQPDSTVSNVSQLSFRDATTSTPRQTPQPRNYLSGGSQTTTPSDGERIDRRASLESTQSQISPPAGGSAPTPFIATSLSPDPQPFKYGSFPGAHGKKERNVPAHLQTTVVHTVQRDTGHRVATTSSTATTTTIAVTSVSTTTSTDLTSVLDAATQPVDEFGPDPEIPDNFEEEGDVSPRTEERLRHASLAAKGKTRADSSAPLPTIGSSGATNKEHELITITEEDEEGDSGGPGSKSPSESVKARVHRRSDSGSSDTRSLKSQGSSGSKSRRPHRSHTGGSVDYVSSDDDDESGSVLADNIDLHVTQSFRGMESYMSDMTFKGGKSRGGGSSLPSSDGGYPRPLELLQPEAQDTAEEEQGPSAHGSQVSDTATASFPLLSEGSNPDIFSQPELTSARELLGSTTSSGSRPRSLRRTRSGHSQSSRSSRSSLSHEGGELPSSQLSNSSGGTNSSTLLQRLQNAAVEVDEDSGAPKRRRRLPQEAGDLHVSSSLPDDDHWDGSDPFDRRSSGATTLTRSSSAGSSAARPRAARSRSGSHDITSFTEETPSEVEEQLRQQQAREQQLQQSQPQLSQQKQQREPQHPSAPAAAVPEDNRQEALQLAGPTTPTKRVTRSSSRLSGSSSGHKSRTSPRKQHDLPHSAPSTPSRRGGGVRRIHQAGDVLRAYKASDAVWAKWNTPPTYFAGTVLSRKGRLDRYEVNFLDNHKRTCPSSQMRPLKLKTGVEAMARSSETTEEVATVEGFEINLEDLAGSWVDVRFFDEGDTERRLELREINFTQEQMDDMDQHMDWDQDYPMVVDKASAETRPRSGSGSSSRRNPFGPPSSSATSSTSHFYSGGHEPSSDPIVPATPGRRTRATPYFFKNYKFLLSFPAPKEEAAREKARLTLLLSTVGGVVLEEFDSTVVQNNRDVGDKVFLLSPGFRRTKKYFEALALGVPRVSIRWVENCVKERELIPWEPYQLPTGYSKELGTIVSSVPRQPGGVFAGCKVGLCITDKQWTRWASLLRHAGAEAVKITATTGHLDCNYIIFGSQQMYENYLGSNPTVASLTLEWFIQCLVNQRIVLASAHPSYTDFETYDDPKFKLE